MKAKIFGAEIDLTLGDQATFLLGGVAGFVLDGYMVFSATGAECAIAGSAAVLGMKRAVESVIGDARTSKVLLEQSATLRPMLQENGRADLVEALDRQTALFEQNFFTSAEFETSLRNIVDEFSGNE